MDVRGACGGLDLGLRRTRLAVEDVLADRRVEQERHLADHRSGLPMGLGPDAPVDVPGKVQAAMRLPLRHPPGDQAAYGFLDYVVLGRVLEIAGGAPLEELMRAYVFAPLGLRDTVFDHEQQDGPLRSADILPHRARTYGWDPGAGRQRSSDFLYPVAGYAAGGLYSSLRDLEAVMTALQGDAFLDPVARDALWTGPTLADGSTSGFALGWTRQRVAGHEAAGHSGGPALSDLLLFPEDGIAVVVLCNQRRLMPVIAAGVAERLLPRQAPLPPVADAMPALSQGFDDLLRDAAAGAVSADRFDGAGQREALPFLQDLGQVMLASLGPVETRRLVEASAQDALVRRVYGTRHDGFWRYWELVTDAAGRIHAFRPWTPPAATAPLAAHG